MKRFIEWAGSDWRLPVTCVTLILMAAACGRVASVAVARLQFENSLQAKPGITMVIDSSGQSKADE